MMFISKKTTYQGNRRHTNASRFTAKINRAILKLQHSRWLSPTWLACIPLTAIIVGVWSLAAVAQTDAPPLTAEMVQGYLNTAWVLIASILVIFMNAGFCMLETGFCRQKNAVNVLAKNLIVFALATLIFWGFGFSFMFGGENPLIGGGGYFLTGQPETYGLAPFPAGLPVPLFFLFQVAFAGTAATIVSGAVAERIEFIAFLIFSVLLVGIAYPITGHWIWDASGWLYQAGFKDFAGNNCRSLRWWLGGINGGCFPWPPFGSIWSRWTISRHSRS